MIDIEQLRNCAKNIKLFATDLDGTLLDSKHTLKEVSREALISLSKNGIIVAAATGRALTSLPDSITSMESVKYLITANGAKIYLNSTGELIYEKYLSEKALDSVMHFFSEPNIMCEAFWDGIPHVEMYRYNDAKNYGIPKWFSDYFFQSRKPLDDFFPALRKNMDKIENINFVFGDEEVKKYVFNELSANKHLYELTTSFPFNYEIGGIGVSKGTAVDFLTKRENILQEQTICFGDNENDISMIEYAGIGVATANAVPKAIEAADYVTEDNENDGVAKALKMLGLI